MKNVYDKGKNSCSLCSMHQEFQVVFYRKLRKTGSSTIYKMSDKPIPGARNVADEYHSRRPTTATKSAFVINRSPVSSST